MVAAGTITTKEITMPLYLYQASYTAESLAAQIKKPADRLEKVEKQVRSTGVRFVTGGFSFGDYDLALVMDAPDDTTVAAIALAIAAGGAIRSSKTTRLLSGAEYVEALKKASTVGYKPAK
jgi:uncharacterized protein with GYD domain